MVQYDRFYFNMKQWHHYSANELATQYSNTWLVLAVAVKEHFRNPPPSPALLAYICYRVIYCVLYMENMKIVSPSFFFLSDKLKEPIHIKFWSDRTSTKYLRAEKYLVLKKACRPLSLDRIQSMSKCKATLGSVRGRPPSEGQNSLTLSPSRFNQPQTGQLCQTTFLSNDMLTVSHKPSAMLPPPVNV